MDASALRVNALLAAKAGSDLIADVTHVSVSDLAGVYRAYALRDVDAIRGYVDEVERQLAPSRVAERQAEVRKAFFHLVTLLGAIKKEDFEAAGIDVTDERRWVSFCIEPVVWLSKAGDDDRQKVWALLDRLTTASPEQAEAA